jgi:hypothetical protein
MKHVLPYALFEASATAALTAEQIDWLDRCARGSWKLNPSTGLIDVVGDFYCNVKGLTDFKGVKFGKASGDFYCNGNQLTSLEGAPPSVGGNFRCDGNQLTSLVGAPQSVGGHFSCRGNQLTTLEGAPQSVGGNFHCVDNPVSESTLKAIFALMRKGMGYQQALEEYWSKMGDEDRVLMYKQMPNLPPEETRKYNALATYANIKNYL